ncbi:unnamed protein product [Schistosoma curassoni]|uniref:CBF domain-containing protein n=1 Tax=Schistosoma curassoni TaxID=6186 RepID=A0A183KEM7_9TREM|nr:unnamed protein product [Schistosoma curassoni]
MTPARFIANLFFLDLLHDHKANAPHRATSISLSTSLVIGTLFKLGQSSKAT